MKFGTPIRRALALLLASSLAALARANAADKKDKQKAAANQTIDSGSFGIFIKGQRVATETFHIEQQNGASIIKSQLKDTAGSDSSQKSELEMTFEWRVDCATNGASLLVVR